MDRESIKALASTLNGDQDANAEIVKYLAQFGYIQEFAPHNGGRAAMTELDLTKALVAAQEILGVQTTGEPDAQTLKAMLMTPRCGRPDYEAARADVNRWVLSKAHAGISYCIKDFITTIPRDSQKQIIMQSFQAWEAVCKIVFIPTNDPTRADIVISCSDKRDEEFGTAGNVLAWAYLPQGSNHSRQLLCKFDLAETWALSVGDQGILLLAVATHEFGHLCGLDHTQIKGELMFPIYAPNLWLPQDRYDKPSMVTRYGEPVVAPPPPPPPGVDPFREWVLFNERTGEKRRIAA